MAAHYGFFRFNFTVDHMKNNSELETLLRFDVS